MTDTPAAIQGTFTKLTAVSTRKVAVLHIEVPIERADAAMHALGGFPDPANPVWVAVALINPSAAPEAAVAQETTEPEKPKGGRLSRQAAMCCDDPRFWGYLTDTFEPKGVHSKDLARQIVLDVCGIKSRAELDNNDKAGVYWLSLHAGFLADGGLGT